MARPLHDIGHEQIGHVILHPAGVGCWSRDRRIRRERVHARSNVSGSNCLRSAARGVSSILEPIRTGIDPRAAPQTQQRWLTAGCDRPFASPRPTLPQRRIDRDEQVQINRCEIHHENEDDSINQLESVCRSRLVRIAPGLGRPDCSLPPVHDQITCTRLKNWAARPRRSARLPVSGETFERIHGAILPVAGPTCCSGGGRHLAANSNGGGTDDNA
jgi:hypothetical protein